MKEACGCIACADNAWVAFQACEPGRLLIWQDVVQVMLLGGYGDAALMYLHGAMFGQCAWAAIRESICVESLPAVALLLLLCSQDAFEDCMGSEVVDGDMGSDGGVQIQILQWYDAQVDSTMRGGWLLLDHVQVWMAAMRENAGAQD